VLENRLRNPENRKQSRVNTTQRYAAFIYLMLTLGYTGGIYWLSSLPGDATQGGLSGIIAWTPPALQNLLHVPLFGLLAWLWHRTLVAWNMHHRPAFCAAFMLAVGFGIFDEWHQLHVPGRYASFTDIALNCTGAALVLWWVHSGKHRQAHP
jgi:hypothetical protein